MSGVTVAKLSVKVSPDTSNFRRELGKQLETLDRDLKVKVGIDAGGAKAHMRETMAALQVEAAKGVDVKVRVDRKGLGGMSSLPSMPDGAGAGAVGGGLLSSLGGGGDISMVVKAVAVLAAAAPAVGVISGALASLPGVIAGIAAPIGAIALGLDGVKRAASSLQEPFAQLKASVSSTFEQALLPVFEKLKGIFPTLTAGMSQVATGLSTAFGGIVNALTSSGGLASLEGIFKNVGAAIGAAAPGLQSLTTGLLGMAQNVTALFPQMAQTFNSLGKSFGNWVKDVTTAGPGGVSKLQGALQGLGSIAGTIGPILGDLFNKGLAFLNDPAAMAGLNATITMFGKLASAVMSLSSGAFSLLGNSIRMIQNAFAGVITTVGQVASTFMSIGSTISGAFSTAVGAVESGVSAIMGAISGGFSSLVGIVQSAWSAVVGAIQSGISTAVAAVSSFGSQVVAACSNFGGLLVSAGADLIRGLINGIKSMAGAALAAVRDVASSAVGAVKGLLGINSPSKVFHEIGVFVGQGLDNGLQSQIGQVSATAGHMAQAVTDNFQKGLDLSGTADVNGGENPGIKAANSALKIPQDFTKAVGGQFMSDIGIGGNGAITGGAAAGIQYIFQVSNIDEALSVKDRADSKQAMSLVGR